MSADNDPELTGQTPNKRAARDARIRELHEAGMSRNAIAVEVGCSAGTVTNTARRLGLTLDASRTAVATAVAVEAVSIRRARISERLLDTTEIALENVEATTNASDARQWATVAGICVDKLAVFDRIENGSRLHVGIARSSIDSEIEELMKGLIGPPPPADTAGPEN